MKQLISLNKHKLFITFSIALTMVGLLFIWQGHIGLNLWDEGFLWYGTQRVMLGEVPIRDFMAYDPGRYYWSATLMHLFGSNGIMALRISVAIFQMLGLFIALLLIAKSLKNKNALPFLILSGVILIIWMFPRHKLYDISLSIFLIGILTLLIQRPTAKRYFLSGIGIGLIAIFGRNHGLYGAIGSLGAIFFLSIKRLDNPNFFKAIILWSIGVIVGFTPIMWMTFYIPGFGNAFWESILFLFELKATNLTLPVPYPWTVHFSALPLQEAIREILIGCFFLTIFVCGCLAPLWAILMKLKRKPIQPVLVASAFLILPYAHYAYSRADIGHLALGIFPFLIGCLALLASKRDKIKWSFAILLAITSFWVMYSVHPGWQSRLSGEWIDVKISGSSLRVDPNTADNIALLYQLNNQYASQDKSFIATPFWPGAYALLEKKSPMWEIYALVPRSTVFQEKEIQRIKAFNPGFALIFDLPLDGNDKLRFKNTHPLIHQYILDNFVTVPHLSNPDYHLYKARHLSS